MTWLQATLREIEDKQERERERQFSELELRVIDRTSEVGEKWRAEIKLLEDIGYNGRELDLEDGEDYDLLKRRVDLLRAALDDRLP